MPVTLFVIVVVTSNFGVGVSSHSIDLPNRERCEDAKQQVESISSSTVSWPHRKTVQVFARCVGPG